MLQYAVGGRKFGQEYSSDDLISIRRRVSDFKDSHTYNSVGIVADAAISGGFIAMRSKNILGALGGVSCVAGVVTATGLAISNLELDALDAEIQYKQSLEFKKMCPCCVIL